MNGLDEIQTVKWIGPGMILNVCISHDARLAFIEPADKKELLDFRARLGFESALHFNDGCRGMCLANFLSTLMT